MLVRFVFNHIVCLKARLLINVLNNRHVKVLKFDSIIWIFNRLTEIEIFGFNLYCHWVMCDQNRPKLAEIFVQRGHNCTQTRGPFIYQIWLPEVLLTLYWHFYWHCTDTSTDILQTGLHSISVLLNPSYDLLIFRLWYHKGQCLLSGRIYPRPAWHLTRWIQSMARLSILTTRSDHVVDRLEVYLSSYQFHL